MTAAGLIFANIHDQSIPELTRVRSVASVPFGCRYRLIDFTLSNMVNSDINSIGLITDHNYQSLLDHIGTGKDWDLARRSGGIKLIPPHIADFDFHSAGKTVNHRLEALLGAQDFIKHCNDDVFVLSDCDIICNIDLSKVIEAHAAAKADITFVTKRVDAAGMHLAEQVTIIDADENGVVTDVTRATPDQGLINLYTNIMVISRDYLLNVLANAAARGQRSFYTDVILPSLGTANFRTYEYDGWYAYIGSLEGYFASSMDMLSQEAREGLFSVKNRPILTKVRNSAPTRYCEGAKVVNSVVAEGCVIEGTVENSIIFRGVKVGKGAVVKNCILFQDTYVCDGAQLNCVITDKNVVIKDRRNLSGHETMPFYIGKNMSV
jgi:glucose-1-phosphate adenylyltransferase